MSANAEEFRDGAAAGTDEEQATDTGSPRGDMSEPAGNRPGPDPQRPTKPWRPGTFTVFAPKRKRTKDRTTGKAIWSWQVRGRADGWTFSRTFKQPYETRDMAVDWVSRLRRELDLGWVFDIRAKRFLPPAQVEPATILTVFELASEYRDRNWDGYRPGSRQAMVRALIRSCLHHLRPGAPELPACCEPFLQARFDRTKAAEFSAEDRAIAETFLEEWSSPADAVTWKEIESLLDKHKTNSRNVDKPVAVSTDTRFRADVRKFWSESAARHDFRDPYQRLHAITKSERRRRNAATRVKPVDAEMVLSPIQIQLLAIACRLLGSWGGVVVCFILVMGFCGLRPGEAAGLRCSDLELPTRGSGWVTLRRTLSEDAERWLDADEDSQFGPLKQREEGASRHAPIPPWLVSMLRWHLDEFCASSKAHDLLFTHRGKPFDPSTFSRYVWQPARAALFPPDPDLPADDPRQPKLARLTPHGLRHAACSLWLNAGTNFKVCQIWSGQQTLSVFLDIYQGIIPGSEEEGVAKLEDEMGRWGLAE